MILAIADLTERHMFNSIDKGEPDIKTREGRAGLYTQRLATIPLLSEPSWLGDKNDPRVRCLLATSPYSCIQERSGLFAS